MSKICDYVYCNGHNVICSITNTVLGDIMGYDGNKCYNCNYRKVNKKKVKTIKVRDTNNITRKLTLEQVERIEYMKKFYDIDAIMLVRGVCIVVLHSDFIAYFVYKDGSTQKATILDI